MNKETGKLSCTEAEGCGQAPWLSVPCDEVCVSHLLSLLLSLSHLSCQGVGYNIVSKPFQLPGGSDGKESSSNAGDLGLIPGLGRSLGEMNDNPLQYSCLENPMDREAWWATVHGITKSQTQLSDYTFIANSLHCTAETNTAL